MPFKCSNVFPGERLSQQQKRGKAADCKEMRERWRSGDQIGGYFCGQGSNYFFLITNGWLNNLIHNKKETN